MHNLAWSALPGGVREAPREPPQGAPTTHVSARIAELARLVEQVSEFILLRLEVMQVILVRSDLDRHALDDAQSVTLQPDHLARVVCQQADVAHAEVVEDLGADTVLAQVGGVAEALVRLDGVQALLLLQLVRLQFGQEADAAA